jgi:streptothricin hydrolase
MAIRDGGVLAPEPLGSPKPQGSGSLVERGSAPASALVVIDAQMKLLDGPTAVPSALETTARIAEVLAAARSAGALVLHLQNDGQPGARDEPNSPGWSIHPAVEPRSGEPLLRKRGDDGFEGTHLEALLRQAGVRRLAVAGLLSEMCVSATIRAAFARGFEVLLVRGAHATYDLQEIPADVVSRVAEHALGDQLELADASAVAFIPPPERQ